MKNEKKNILIVGAGFYGSIFAHELKGYGFKVTIIDKRKHIGGNCFTERINEIDIHKYGPHIFHTNDEKIWKWINKFTTFQPYIFSPVADFKGIKYSLPFNLWTFNQIYGNISPDQIKKLIDEFSCNIPNPKNLEEKAISLVGKDVYEILIKGYTEKQWGRKATELPASIITRLPVRLTYNTNYFNDTYQGIPLNGYTEIFEKLLEGVELHLNTDYINYLRQGSKTHDHVIYTGPIDEFFDYKYGKLEYRSLKWENKELELENFQGNSVVNYTSHEVPYTRIIEHKHFINNPRNKTQTLISKEFPQKYNGKNEPYYPINDLKNNNIFKLYKDLSKQSLNVTFGGRLATYRYYDMHQVIASALSDSRNFIEKYRF